MFTCQSQSSWRRKGLCFLLVALDRAVVLVEDSFSCCCNFTFNMSARVPSAGLLETVDEGGPARPFERCFVKESSLKLLNPTSEVVQKTEPSHQITIRLI